MNGSIALVDFLLSFNKIHASELVDVLRIIIEKDYSDYSWIYNVMRDAHSIQLFKVCFSHASLRFPVKFP